MWTKVICLFFLAVADGFYRAAFEGFHAEVCFLLVFRLLLDEGVATIIVACEVLGSCLATVIAIYAFLVHEEFPGDVVGPLFIVVCHGFSIFFGGGCIRLSPFGTKA